ncbi:MAG TPA: cupin domain-containing protein [Candidatus Fraserbacteria bacterium]|nr:cupin domain-containing protein [Candidatus Fraserbacteria bacterium]
MPDYEQLLSLSDQPWQGGIAAGIEQKPIWMRGDSNSHAQVMLVRMASGVLSPPHRHPHPQIFYVLSGNGRLELDERVYQLKEGDAVRVLGGELHGFENTGSAELVMLEIQLFDIKIDLKKLLAGQAAR